MGVEPILHMDNKYGDIKVYYELRPELLPNEKRNNNNNKY